jgi:cyclopropane-fatty-acyl-phospholipid synthase
VTLEKNQTPQQSQGVPALEPVRSGPRTAISAAVAKRLFRAAVNRLHVTVHEGRPGTKGGRVLGQGGPTMTLHRPEEFYARLGRDGLIGFGESYMTGAWEADDLAGFLTVPAARMATLIPEPLQRLRAYVTPRLPSHHRSSEANSQANISHHYDLSNDLFELFLDDTLSYSSALFDTSHVPAGVGPGSVGDHLLATPPEPGARGGDRPDPAPHDADFTEAQGRKIERLLDEAGVAEGTRVLEIGTGWGELAIRAARRGARVHSITLSIEQLELAEQRIAAAGFSDSVDVELMDYRALGADGAQYDAVLSVEMIEAVGAEFWGTYFRTIDQVLAPGGKVAIQAITMPHDRMLATRDGETWINKYIFPGGFLPSVEVIDQITRDETGLRLTGQLEMGSHYAETLRRWDRRFLAQRDGVLALGFDDVFMRVWHFYLAYSQAGFASGYINVSQLTFTRQGQQEDQ